MGKKKDNITAAQNNIGAAKTAMRKNKNAMQKNNIGRALTYILLYSWIIPIYIGVIFALSCIIESFTCSNFKVSGELCSGLNVLFGYGCAIMCGDVPAFSNILMNLAVLSLLFACIISVFAMTVMKLVKVQILKGKYKLDPATNFIAESILKIISRRKR